MSNISYIKTFLDEKYFELPKNKVTSFFKSFSAGYSSHKIESIMPFLFVVNKTSDFDKFFVSHTLNCTFVFLKDEVVQKFYSNTLSKNEKQELAENFKKLKQALISVVVFPEKKQTVFGETGVVCKELTDFVFELNFNIKFLSLINTFFLSPVWTNEMRRCDTTFNQQFNLKVDDYKEFSKERFFEKFNKCMPSSTSQLMRRFNPRIRSHKRAEHIETMFFCCPNCEEFFSLYSEFNCLKCKNCGSALEFAFNGGIELSSKVSNLDEFASFQLEKLQSCDFGKKPIICYNKLNYLKSNYRNKVQILGEIEAEFFANKIHIFKNNFDKTYTFKDIEEMSIQKNNVLHIKTKNDEEFIHGPHHENMYFFVELFNNSKNKD